MVPLPLTGRVVVAGTGRWTRFRKAAGAEIDSLHHLLLHRRAVAVAGAAAGRGPWVAAGAASSRAAVAVLAGKAAPWAAADRPVVPTFGASRSR